MSDSETGYRWWLRYIFVPLLGGGGLLALLVGTWLMRRPPPPTDSLLHAPSATLSPTPDPVASAVSGNDRQASTAQPTIQTSPEPSPNDAERIASEVAAARPLQRQKVAKTFLDIPVDWKLYFSTGEVAERLTTLHFDSSLGRSRKVGVMVQVFTKDHEDLALLDVGTPLRVRGRIQYVTDNFIVLKDAEVERLANP